MAKQKYCINIIEIRESDYEDTQEIYVIRNAYRWARDKKDLNSIITYMRKKYNFYDHDDRYGSISIKYRVETELVKEKEDNQLRLFDDNLNPIKY